MTEKEDWAVCQAILTALADDYEDFQELDEEGEIAAYGGEAVELMGECLAESRERDWGAGWLEALLSAELTGI